MIRGILEKLEIEESIDLFEETPFKLFKPIGDVNFEKLVNELTDEQTQTEKTFEHQRIE